MKQLFAPAFALCLAATPLCAADTYGLVIGIDEYDHVPDLQGAVNDANDIADALRSMGAEVTLLLNHEASRAAIFRAWEDMAARVQPGDRFVITYAGHGSYEPEFLIGSEEDGRDENFLLSRFDFTGADAGERIRDDEIAGLLAMTPGAEVVFLADSCHSGTVSRNVTPVLGYRYVTGGELSDDPLPPPPPRVSVSEGKEDVALFMAAVDEASKVPEFLINGQARGALSFAFAQGLRGAADADENGEFTKDEIATYVRRNVREISQGLQAPQISPRGGDTRVLFAQPGAEPAANPDIIAVSLFEKALPALPALKVAHNGGAFGDEVLAGIPGAQIVADATQATIVADFDRNEIRTTLGDTLLSLDRSRPADSLSRATDKMRVLSALQSSMAPSPLEVRFAQGDGTYRAGERITVQIAGRSTAHITLLAMAPDGAVGVLYPIQGDGLDDPDTVPWADTLDLTLEITPPFGADHIIAIETTAPAPDMRAVLAALDTRTARTAELWEVLRTAVLRLPSQPRMAVFPFYTSAE